MSRKDDRAPTPLPYYLEHGAGYERYSDTLPGPYSLNQASLAVYLLRADWYCTRGLVQSKLGRLDSDYWYLPLPAVALTMLNVEAVELTLNPELGPMHEVDGALQIPVLFGRKQDEGEGPELGLGAYVPWIWVNTATAMATGREVLGMEKMVGSSFADVPDHEIRDARQLTRIRAHVNPYFGAPLQERNLVQICHDNSTKAPESRGLMPELAHLSEDVADDLASLVFELTGGRVRHDAQSLIRFVESSEQLDLPTLLLKQIRGAVNSERAVIQSVNHYTTRFFNPRIEPLDHPEIRIENFASHPLVDQLGLDPKFSEGQGLRPSHSSLMRFNLQYDLKAPGPPPRKKVVVLGGGPSALSAMMDLSKYPDEIELSQYQMGWRLGGKCASSMRTAPFGDEPDAPKWLRNEEHGIHLALGFYENFFDLLRTAYDGLNRGPEHPLRRWTDAVKGRNSFTMQDNPWGRWHRWSLEVGSNDLVPGRRARHADASNGRPELWHGVLGLLAFVERAASDMKGHAKQSRIPGLSRLEGRILDELQSVIAALYGETRPSASLATKLVGTLVDVLEHAEPIVSFALSRLKGQDEDGEDWPFSLYKAWVLIELSSTIVLGLCQLWQRGQSFDDINHLELSDWFTEIREGKPMSSWTRNSALIRTIYMLPFAFRDGEADQPCMAAGTAIRGLVRILFDFAGAPAYDFQAGMGEAIIAPFYEFIRKRNRNCRFNFFCRVRKLEVKDGRIEKVIIGRQATLKPEYAAYQPFLKVKGTDVFPDRPLYEQLVQGEALKEGRELPGGGYDLESNLTRWQDVEQFELVRGRDFDDIVLGIPSTALAEITEELSAAEPRWQSMLDHVTGISTMSMQFWTTETLKDLGWHSKIPSEQEQALILGYVQDLGALGDFSRVLKYADWQSAETAPKGVVYTTGPMSQRFDQLPEHINPIEAGREFVTNYAQNWMQRNIGELYPGLKQGNTLDWSKFADPRGRVGPARFRDQFFLGNISASAQYITSFPGTIEYRLAPDSCLFENLYLAGDWARNGLDIGSLEGSVLSGRIAARAILGRSYALYGEAEPWPWVGRNHSHAERALASGKKEAA